MVNEWNRMAVKNSANSEAVRRLREPVIGYPDDFIVFSYLNFLRTNRDMWRAKLIPKSVELAAIRNGAWWLAKLSRRDLDQLLTRGYDDDFRNQILLEYDKLPKPSPEFSNAPENGGDRPSGERTGCEVGDQQDGGRQAGARERIAPT